MLKKLNLYAYSIQPKKSVYKRDFDQTKFMYFLMKDENFFDRYNEVWEKSYLKVKLSTKEGFQCFCVRVILIDLVYEKIKNIILKCFLKLLLIILMLLTNFNKDMEVYSNDSYYVDSDEEYSVDSDASDKKRF